MTGYASPVVTFSDPDETYTGYPSLFDDVYVIVEFGFGFEPLETVTTWVTVNDFTRSVDIKRGKQSPYGQYGAGTATIKLSNNDRRFDPLYASSPYYGDLKPMVPVRVVSSYGTGEEVLFYGFVQIWQTDYETANNDNVTTVQCVDLTRILGNSTLPKSGLHGEIELLNPVSYIDMQEMYDNPDVVSGRAGRQTFDDYEADNPLVRVTGVLPRPANYRAMLPVGAEKHVEMVKNDTWLVSSMTTAKGFVYGAECWFELRETSDYNFEVQWGVSQDISGQLHEATWDLGLYDGGTSPKTYQFLWPVVLSEVLGVTGGNGASQIQLSLGVHCWAWSLTQSGGTWYLKNYIDGVLENTITLSSGTPSIVAGNQLLIDPQNTGTDVHDAFGASHFAVFPSAPSGTEFEKHWDAGQGYIDTVHARADRVLDWASIPSAWRDIDTNTSGGLTRYRPDAQTVGAYLQQLAYGDGGDWFVNKDGYVRFVSGTSLAGLTPSHTFGTGNLPFSNVKVSAATIDSVVNHVIVQTFRGDAESEDATSVATYGRMTETISVPTIESIAKGKSIADARVAARKDPQTEIRSLAVDLRSDTANLWSVLAGMDLDEALTVSFTPNDVGSAISQNVRVQGISHSITPKGWKSELFLGAMQ